jgi:hypothetical protein
MEKKTEASKVRGLTLKELETHSRAELLPDRLEMRRRSGGRRRSHHGGGHHGGGGGGGGSIGV